MISLNDLNVLHVNATDSLGGAAKACYRLHEAMILEGISSSILVQRKALSEDRVYNFSKIDQVLFSKIRRRYNSYVAKRTKSNMGSFSPNGLGRDITTHRVFKDADVIYLHYINSGFLNTNSVLKVLRTGKPVVWFLHDMWAFTGGCHYSFDCDKYKVQCFSCPNLLYPHESDLSRRVFDSKLALSDFQNLAVVAPSSWLCNLSSNSRLFGSLRNLNIPNTLNENVFTPIDRNLSRKKFALPLHKKMILFGAIDAIKNPYKGWGYLTKAINSLHYTKEEIQLVVFGSEGNDSIRDSLKYDISFVGYINNDEILNELYNAADVFVLPSLADNFPNTLLESLFCGIPCVGFDVGGVRDLIVTGATGYLATPLDFHDLANGVKLVLDAFHLRKVDIRTFALSQFGRRIVMEKHANLISQMFA